MVALTALRSTRRLLLLSCVLLTSGCTTAGPFVTNIGLSGPGQLAVEKCLVQFDSYNGTISNKDCKTSYVYIGSETVDLTAKPASPATM